MQEFHCPLLRAVRQCNAAVAPPTNPRQCGGAVKELHCHTAPGQCDSALQEFHCPLPQGSEAVHCRNSTAHSRQAIRQCIARVPLPTAPRQ